MAKLIAARGQPVCDVIEILDATWDQMVELDFVVDELDFSLLPNAKHLADWQIGKNFTGSWFTQEGICYNAEKFAEHGIPTPTTYKDLIHPKLEGLIQIPDITSGGGLANFGGIVKAAGGDENNVKPGLDLINAMNVKKFWKRGSEGVTLLENGDIWALISHVGWCMRGHKAGQTYLKFVHPIIDDEHVGVNKFGFLSIVKNSPHGGSRRGACLHQRVSRRGDPVPDVLSRRHDPGERQCAGAPGPGSRACRDGRARRGGHRQGVSRQVQGHRYHDLERSVEPRRHPVGR